MRNYSALNMPVKGKMQLQILNSEHGITAYERARMALKLLVNYGKRKEYEAEKLANEREQYSRKNAAITKRLGKQNPDYMAHDEDLKSLLGSMRSGTERQQRVRKMRQQATSSKTHKNAVGNNSNNKAKTPSTKVTPSKNYHKSKGMLNRVATSPDDNNFGSESSPP